MSEKISMINLKGGVGKTVSSINIAYSFAEFGKKVLIVDTDSQGNIAISLGVNPDELENTLFNLMEKGIKKAVTKEQVQECILTLGNVDILPSNSELAKIDSQLMNTYRREYILQDIISVVENMYDYIIIDCPPSLGTIVINALTASDYVLIPVEAHYLSFESLKVMLGTIEMVKLRLNPNLKIAGVFLTMFQSRTKLSKGIKEQLCEIYGDEIKVFDEYVPYSIKAAEQTLYGKSLIELDKNHPVSVAYLDITKGLMNNGE